MSNPYSSKVFELIERKGDQTTKKILKDKKRQLELAEIQLYSASDFDQIWLTNRALKLRNEIQGIEKPFMEEVLEKLNSDRLRAAKVISHLENEMLKTGVDEEMEWFLDYVWEKIHDE